MNRPEIPRSNGDYTKYAVDLIKYLRDINIYCDELEHQNKTLKVKAKYYSRLKSKYERALDKALVALEYKTGLCPLEAYDYHCSKCKEDEELCCKDVKSCWKEWCLENEQTKNN